MKTASTLALAGLLLLTACAARRDDSRYVALGTRRGYYVIEPGSPLQDQLGYGLAPVADTASPLRRGQGIDVIAFRFDRRGVLAQPPAYLAQLGPEQFYTRRLATLVQGSSTWASVQRWLPTRHQRRIPQPDGGLLVYHEIPVFNPFEEMSGRDVN